jgi:hypothetical protein
VMRAASALHENRREVMSHNSAARQAVARGGMIFAAVTLLISGIFQILTGVVALRNSAFFGRVGNVGNYTYTSSLHNLGWAHIVGGIIVGLVGLGLFSGATWARGLGILVAGLSIIGNFLFIPYYPVWSVLIIALDVFVIWSLANVRLGGREARYDERQAASAYGGDQRWATTNTAGGYATSDVAARNTQEVGGRQEGARHSDAEREFASDQMSSRRGGR